MIIIKRNTIVKITVKLKKQNNFMFFFKDIQESKLMMMIRVGREVHCDIIKKLAIEGENHSRSFKSE